jgi:hypothetical protein
VHVQWVAFARRSLAKEGGAWGQRENDERERQDHTSTSRDSRQGYWRDMKCTGVRSSREGYTKFTPARCSMGSRLSGRD